MEDVSFAWAVVYTILALLITSLLLMKIYVFPHWENDFRFVVRAAKIQKEAAAESFVESVDKTVRVRSKQVAMINAMTGAVVTFAELGKQTDRVANWLATTDLKPEDTVALLANNEPEFVLWWVGLLKAGLRVAFLNFNLRGRSLAHCVRACGARSLIALSSDDGGEKLLGAAEEVVSLLNAEQSGESILFFSYGGKAQGAIHVHESDLASAEAVTFRPAVADPAVFIFTRSEHYDTVYD